MGIFDKVKFWKHEDFTIDPGQPADSPIPQFDQGAPGFQQDPLNPPRPDQFSQGFSQGAFPQQDPMSQAGRHDAFGHDVFQQQPYGQQSYPQQSFSQQQSYPGTAQFPGSAASHHEESPYFDRSMAGSQQAGPSSQRDVELIIAKLDAIKSELDALHQRVRRIEQMTDNQQPSQRRYW